jgi:hypothetical protein
LADLKLKKIYSWKFNFYFLDQKLQKRTSCTFFYFCRSFLPSWIRIRNLNPDPATQINADPSGSGYGSGSATLLVITMVVGGYRYQKDILPLFLLVSGIQEADNSRPKATTEKPLSKVSLPVTRNIFGFLAVLIC